MGIKSILLALFIFALNVSMGIKLNFFSSVFVVYADGLLPFLLYGLLIDVFTYAFPVNLLACIFLFGSRKLLLFFKISLFWSRLLSVVLYFAFLFLLQFSRGSLVGSIFESLTWRNVLLNIAVVILICKINERLHRKDKPLYSGGITQ